MSDNQKLYVKAPAAPKVPVEQRNLIVPVGVIDMVRALISGVAVGVIGTGLFYVLNTYIFGAALCRPGVEGCSAAPVYSTIVAVIAGAIVGIVALARLGVYRPLPVALAVAIALWGVFGFMPNVVWYWGIVVGAVLFGLSYVVFAWAARIRSFVVSLIVLALVTVIVRIVIG